MRNSVSAKFRTLRVPSPTRSPCENFTRCNQRQKKYYTKTKTPNKVTRQTSQHEEERDHDEPIIIASVMQHAELGSSAQSLVGFAAGAKRRARITISLCQMVLWGQRKNVPPGAHLGWTPVHRRVRIPDQQQHVCPSVRRSRPARRRTKGLVTLLCARQPLFTIGESRSCC